MAEWLSDLSDQWSSRWYRGRYNIRLVVKVGLIIRLAPQFSIRVTRHQGEKMGFLRTSVALAAVVQHITASPLIARSDDVTSYGGMSSISPNPQEGHWVDTWTAMPQLTEFANLPPPPYVGIMITLDHSLD